MFEDRQIEKTAHISIPTAIELMNHKQYECVKTAKLKAFLFCTLHFHYHAKFGIGEKTCQKYQKYAKLYHIFDIRLCLRTHANGKLYLCQCSTMRSPFGAMPCAAVKHEWHHFCHVFYVTRNSRRKKDGKNKRTGEKNRIPTDTRTTKESQVARIMSFTKKW